MPPRLDLGNESLLRSHLQAVWLAETGQSLYSQLTEILDVDSPAAPIKPDIARVLTDPEALRRATRRAESLLAPMLPELSATAWWRDGWAADVVARAHEAFDAACQRWRDLYQAALRDQEEQNRLVLDASTHPRTRKDAEGRRRQAENQLRLLRNEDSDRTMSDFYFYRYFASEGFLPGYSFPRLPLAAYIPSVRAGTTRYDGGDYIQRPRFIAISEFGPGALIYHEGARYQVDRVQVPMASTGEGTVDVRDARICGSCGYLHERGVGTDVCEHCGARLGVPDHNLMRMQTVFTRRRERISSDEEERRRSGFDLVTTYRFSDQGHSSGRLHAEVVDETGPLIASLDYGDTATVRITNRGRRRRRDPDDIGYPLDTVTGRWVKDESTDAGPEDEDLEDPSKAQRVQRVIPYVEDTRNVVVFRLTDHVTPEQAVTLRVALERGIETAFQLEDSELDSALLPDPDGRGRMLFVEAAEGGAGALRRLQGDPDALATAARAALDVIHYDPDTGEDLGHAEGATERCERACYDCLLSYRNQLEHELIDRHLVSDLLLQLARSCTIPSGTDETRSSQVERLLTQCTNDLERRWVESAVAGDYRLPDEAQPELRDHHARPDFAYRESHVAVFVDGPMHDSDRVAERDKGVLTRLEDAGWMVIRFRYDEDWEAVFEAWPSVFGTGRR